MKPVRLLIAVAMLSAGAYAQSATQRQSEDIDLDIKQEQIVETNFERATSIARQTEKVRVEAGAAVSASRIDVTLRGVTGNVKFRANLDALERLFRRQ